MSVFGGNAFRKGVAFHSGNKSSVAYMDKNGKISVRTEEVKLIKRLSRLKRIPFIRGLAVIAETFLRSWKLNLSVVVIIGTVLLLLDSGGQQFFNFKNVSGSIEAIIENYFVLFVLLAGLIFTKFTRVSKYHGAEHKVFNACKKNMILTLENVRQQTRYAAECGTNFLVFVFVVFTILQLFHINFYICFLIGISVGYEIFIADNKILKKLLKPFYLVGYIIQYFIFTSEPNDKELQVAITAVRGLDKSL